MAVFSDDPFEFILYEECTVTKYYNILSKTIISVHDCDIIHTRQSLF